MKVKKISTINNDNADVIIKFFLLIDSGESTLIIVALINKINTHNIIVKHKYFNISFLFIIYYYLDIILSLTHKRCSLSEF